MYTISLNRTSARRLTAAAICLALCMVLPFLTGQIPQVGSALCPMHIPVLLAGFVCGPWWAAAVGAVAPVLRFALFGMPPLFPTGFAMCFELAAYGLVSGMLYRKLPRRTGSIYAALIGAMVVGRVVWGMVMLALMTAGRASFSWAAFAAGAFLNAIPGIITHIVLIPLLVLALQKSRFLPAEH